MNRTVLDRTVYALSLIGILVVVHLWIMVGRGFDRGCFGFDEPTQFVECEAVIQSDAGTMFGVSNAAWGMLFYAGIFLLSLAVSFGGGRSRQARTLRQAMVSVGFLYAAYLVYVQAVQIGAFCKLCVISAGLVTLLMALVTYDGFRNSMEPNPMQSKKLFVGLALATLVIAVADMSYFSRLAVAEPTEVVSSGDSVAPGEVQPGPSIPPGTAVTGAQSAPGACLYDPAIPAVADFQQLVTFADPFLGTAQSGAQVIEFFDPNCPHCRTMHPIMKRVIETHGDRAQFYLIPYIVFQQSLNQIEAIYVAAQDGKYFEMIDEQFARQKAPGLSIPELAAIAEGMDIDPEVFARRVNRGLNRPTIAARRDQIQRLGVRGVPTVMINGRFVASESKTLACLQEMIEEAGS
jgi:protein-disulfide isomerase/uncharacterized membrane protein